MGINKLGVWKNEEVYIAKFQLFFSRRCEWSPPFFFFFLISFEFGIHFVYISSPRKYTLDFMARMEDAKPSQSRNQKI